MKVVKIPDAEKLFEEYHELQSILNAIHKKENLVIYISKDNTTISVTHVGTVKLKNIGFNTIESLVKLDIEECEKEIEKL